jgi:FkbM family methyltransferase
MGKIFIDCGAHCGCSIRKFESVQTDQSDFTRYSFEANYQLWPLFEEVNTHLIKKAVRAYNGTTKFFIIGDRGGGSTISEIKSKRKHSSSLREEVGVECIDFCEWLVDTFSKDDYIVLKVDIEGAEYKIFDKMFEDGSIEYINELHGELTGQKCGVSNKRDKVLKKELKKRGLPLKKWDAIHKRWCHKDTHRHRDK